MRLRVLLIVVLTVGSSLAVAGSAHAQSFWCSDGVAPPCVESAFVNGTEVKSGDPNWDVDALLVTPDETGGSSVILWNVQSKTNANNFELGPDSLDDTWQVTIDAGTVKPRVNWALGDKVSVGRVDDGDGTYHVSITGNPTVVLGDCDQSVWPWSCPSTATMEWNGYFGGEVTDYNAWADETQREAMTGMDYFTNISATSMPPELSYDSSGVPFILLRLANPHYYPDGTTVFQGFAHVRIPNQFLKQVYGIDDPSTLTGAGLDPSVSGSGSGTISVTQETGGDAMLVNVDGLTFSHRIVRVKRGTITPTKPTNVHAHRKGPRLGTVTFRPSRPRGSRIIGYRAVCVQHNGNSFLARGRSSPIVLDGLTRGVAYSCTVRARSKAGPSLPSAKVRMPAS